MRRTFATVTAVLAGLFAGAPVALAAGVAPPVTGVTALAPSWIRGVVLTSYEPDPFDTSGPSMLATLQTAHADGANWVSIVPECVEKDADATTFHCSYASGDTCMQSLALSGPTISDACLAETIADARSLGMKVALYPHIDPLDATTRSQYDPKRWATWWTTYDHVIEHYAALGAQDGASLLFVGSEMNTADVCSICKAQWTRLISTVHKRFHGELSYAADIYAIGAKHPDYAEFPAWSQLNLIGIDAYYPLEAAPSQGGPADPSVASLVSAWNSAPGHDVATLEALGARFHKPVIASEYGGGDSPYAALNPSGACPAGTGCGSDPQAQANLFSAFFETFQPQRWFDGMFLWNYQADQSPSPSANPHGQVDPRGLAGEQVLRAWWTATG